MCLLEQWIRRETMVVAVSDGGMVDYMEEMTGKGGVD